jgi:zinc protease
MDMFLFLTAAAGGLLGQKIDRKQPPVTPPLPAFRLPPVYETRLSNGLHVVLVEDARFPLITVRLAFQAGSKFDPEELPGLSEGAGALLKEGTATRTSRQIAEELAAIGGSLDGLSGADTLTIAANALAEHHARLLDLVAEVAQNASFPPEEVSLHQANRKQALLVQRSRAAFQAEEKLEELLYGSHPYARTTPTLESIDRLSSELLARFRDRYLGPSNSVLIVLGMLPVRAQLLEAIQERFGGWKPKELPAPPEAKFPAPQRRLVLVNRPGSVQADIRVGRLAVTRRDPDHFPLLVGNTILGGGASSRLFNHIREEKGYAYDAHSALQRMRDSGHFEVATQVRNEVAGEALAAVVEELETISREPVSATELSDVKNYLSGSFVLSLTSQNSLASQIALVRTMGLPNDYLETYTARIRSVEAEQILTSARKYMDPGNAIIVVVGDAVQLSPALEKIGKFEVTEAK